jgi:hypothetical protein
MTITAQNLISASILRLRMKSPFFATLAMFARFLPTMAYGRSETIECPTAATDGKDIFYNEDFIRSASRLTFRLLKAVSAKIRYNGPILIW